MSAWNDFVKKIYHENHSKNKEYSFKNALSDASELKKQGKMDMGLAMGVTKSKKPTKTAKKSRKSRKNKKTKSRRSKK